MGYAPEMCIVCAQEIEDRGCKEGGVGEEEGECVGGLVLGGGLLRGICRHGWCTGGGSEIAWIWRGAATSGEDKAGGGDT